MDKKRHILTLKYIYVQNLKLNKLCFLDCQFKDFFIEWFIIVDPFQNIYFFKWNSKWDKYSIDCDKWTFKKIAKRKYHYELNTKVCLPYGYFNYHILI
jgi:hypothetical protein